MNEKLECQVCEAMVDRNHGEGIYDVGFVCEECLEKADNKTGYCSMYCQLFGSCDGSC
jgi:hypothetical protein